MRPDDLRVLRCPTCRGRLIPAEGPADAGRGEGTLDCACGARWPVRDGLPRLFREGDVHGSDRLLRVVYDCGARLHDPAVRHLLPLFDSCDEATLRDGYLRRLDLASLTPRPGGRPVRILEVGIGGGANLPLLFRDLPPGLPAEVWGLDLSDGMMARCRDRVARGGFRGVRLLMADAHALPFPDAAFDRVFHVGGIGGFRDPGRALAEMVRVAVPGTPVVVVDEQLDPSRTHGFFHRAMFRVLTWYDRAPHCPREHVPAGATAVVEEAISRYYYCLSFRAP